MGRTVNLPIGLGAWVLPSLSVVGMLEVRGHIALEVSGLLLVALNNFWTKQVQLAMALQLLPSEVFLAPLARQNGKVVPNH